MLEIEKLEHEWRKYRARRLKPLMLSVIVILIIGAGYLFFPKSGISMLNKKSEISTSKESSPTVVETKQPVIEQNMEREPHKKTLEANKTETLKQPPAIVASKPQTKPVETSYASVQKTESSITLNPDTEFLESFSNTKESTHAQQAYPVKSSVKHETIAASHLKREETPPKEPNKSDEKPYTAQKDERTSGLMIQSSKQNNTLDYLIKKFNEKRDPKLASYIAQSYYKKGNYEEAVKWSVMANSLDPSGEETWLIFARSKVKLGQKEDAIKALKVYLNQYNSRNVKSFLNSLESSK